MTINRQLADTVIDLISKKTEADQQKALTLLQRYYPNNPTAVAHSYESALLIVTKRNEASGIILKENFNPRADLLALQASDLISQGDVSKAFNFLGAAIHTGARTIFCRHLVFRLLRRLPNRDRMSVISYRAGSTAALEIGQVDGSGFILIPSSPTRSGDMFLKTTDELQIENKLDRVQHRLVDFDWISYFFNLVTQKRKIEAKPREMT